MMIKVLTERRRIYSLRATLALDAFLACIWLGASGTLTSEVVIIHALTRRFGRRPYGESDAWVGVVGAGAGTGGLEVLVFLISFLSLSHGVGVLLINAVLVFCTSSRSPFTGGYIANEGQGGGGRGVEVDGRWGLGLWCLGWLRFPRW